MAYKQEEFDTVRRKLQERHPNCNAASIEAAVKDAAPPKHGKKAEKQWTDDAAKLLLARDHAHPDNSIREDDDGLPR